MIRLIVSEAYQTYVSTVNRPQIAIVTYVGDTYRWL